MRLPRRPRGLSGEDAYLWGEIARLITPLRAKSKPKPKAPDANPPATPLPKAGAKPAHKPSSATPAKPAVKPPAKRVTLKPNPPPAFPAHVVAPPAAAPALAPGLERRVRLAFRRGALQVDARIDLHGMYQAQAHGALTGFLMRARAAGHTHVLVVTGKGGMDYNDAFSERGVLRRSVPHWLRAPELRSIVLGFEEAARHHGGAGALYVRLRRR
ncbi:DNA mismatch repair protein MutS [Methylobacterium sp. Leaf102]|uniref:Smr/MutS family protein n=1 Tax=Methylobacterium sp. Leaf102 TaxID=1736253 RepID=UPI0006F32970|nr:Smr/MutS family protein [Methylobacterium sp. Leaf102]KQP28454.1 DNA mismatch repair protein MutS [Methylobacterium sp. Leaf102]